MMRTLLKNATNNWKYKTKEWLNPFSVSTLMIITIIFMDLLTGMEFDLFVPSFAQLQNHFHLTTFWIEALLSVNFMGYCISLFIVGTLADHYGRKPIILLGLSTFVIGSIICLADSAYWLILLGRFLQGMGIAAPAILSFLIIADRYSLKRQQFFMAMLNGSLNIAAGIAPVIGSYITLYYHWRGNFFTLLLLGIVALVMTLLFIPKDSFSKNKEKLSFGGYGILFQSKPLLLLMTNIILMFVPYWIFVGISPLLYIKNLHVSLYAFGFYQGVLAFVFAIGSIVFGLVINHHSQKKWLSVGLMIYIASLLIMGWATIADNANPLVITLAMLSFVIAQIIPGAILNPLCLNFLPHAKAKVSAVLQGGRLIFSSLILQVVGYFYVGSFKFTGIIITLFIFMIILTQLNVMKSQEFKMDI